jgi:hypothetical protein
MGLFPVPLAKERRQLQVHVYFGLGRGICTLRVHVGIGQCFCLNCVEKQLRWNVPVAVEVTALTFINMHS